MACHIIINLRTIWHCKRTKTEQKEYTNKSDEIACISEYISFALFRQNLPAGTSHRGNVSRIDFAPETVFSLYGFLFVTLHLMEKIV